MANVFLGEDNDSKAKFFGRIQIYLEVLLKVMVHQDRWLTQNFLNTQERCEFLECERSDFCLGDISHMLLGIKQ